MFLLGMENHKTVLKSTDYPYNLMFWLIVLFRHYFSIYAKIILPKKAECHFKHIFCTQRMQALAV